MSKLVQPFTGIVEAGLFELIGVDEQVDQNDFAQAAAVDIRQPDLSGDASIPASGEILSVTLMSSAATALAPDGVLYFLDADPGLAVGATALTEAIIETILGFTVITGADDFKGTAAAKAAHKTVAIPFHELSTIYVLFMLTSSTSFNDGGGDDEKLQANFWFRRDS